MGYDLSAGPVGFFLYFFFVDGSGSVCLSEAGPTMSVVVRTSQSENGQGIAAVAASSNLKGCEV